jgi:hypothetical protein
MDEHHVALENGGIYVEVSGFGLDVPADFEALLVFCTFVPDDGDVIRSKGAKWASGERTGRVTWTALG